MRSLKTLLLVSCLVYWGFCLTPSVKADGWDQKTILTFSQWVQLPGIVLPPGTYVFKILDFAETRDLVQVLSQDEQKVYATVWTIPDYQENRESRPLIVFQERATGAPAAVKEWFYPDGKYGHEFIYSKPETLGPAKADEPESSKSSEVQSAANESGLTQPDDTSYWQVLHERETEPEELAKAEEPESSNESADQSYLQVLRDRQLEEQKKWETPTETVELRELPRTAGYLPLILLFGICMVGVSFGLRLCCKTN